MRPPIFTKCTPLDNPVKLCHHPPEVQNYVEPNPVPRALCLAALKLVDYKGELP